jgi:hypothetical protein
MQLVELLEIPQLVDACSRNGFYDEAMELAIFVNGLERKHVLASEVRVSSTSSDSNGGYGVVQSIVDDVHVTLVELRRQLLVQLAEEASLPKLLQTLGVLRKLDSILIDRQLEDEKHNNFNSLLHTEESFELLRNNLLKRIETTLQMNFLEARSVWMERSIREVLQGHSAYSRLTRPAEGNETATRQLQDDVAGGGGGGGGGDPVLGPYGRGIELLEICRSSWYAIVTQYNALFAESVGEYSSRSLLSFWLENQLNILQEELKDLLVHIDEGPSVRSLIEQCYSFSDRMSQVGCDFSGHMIPIFEEVVLTRIGNTWTRGLSSFKQMVEMEKFMVEVEDGLLEQVIPLYLRQDQEEEEGSGSGSGSGNVSGSDTLTASSTHPSPSSSGLMSYPPLAYLLNSFLIGVNFLRECPLLSLRDQLLALFEQVFRDLCNFLVLSGDDIKMKGKKFILDSPPAKDRHGSKSSTQNTVSYEENMDKVYASKIMDEVIPHCLDCFKLIFSSDPSQQLSSDSKNNLVNTGDLQFLTNIREVEESCRKVLVSGSLVQRNPTLTPPVRSSVASKNKQTAKMKMTAAPVTTQL